MVLRGKFSLLVLSVVLLFVGCKDSTISSFHKEKELSSMQSNMQLGKMLKAENGTVLMNRVMSVSDPMRDPNWDWTTDTIDKLFITSYSEPKNIRRPYYGPSSIKPFFTDGAGHRDIWPKDGWEFVLRDFGTSQYSVPTPFYILYNKHNGILRYFFFGNLVSDQITHAVGTLSLKGAESPLFTLTTKSSEFLNDYSTDKQSTVTKYYQDQWNVIDFRLAGFDPNIDTKTARFVVEIDAYQKFKLNVTGKISLEGVLGVGGSTHSSFVETLQSGVKLYKNIAKGYRDINEAQDTFKDMIKFAESDEHKDAWWSDILAGAASVGATSWIPALGPIVGVANFILGGGSSQSRQPRPITLTGGLELKGTLESTTPISRLEFIIPGSKVLYPEDAAAYNELPLYNKKLGVFNLVRAPKVTGKSYGDCYSSSYSINSSKTSEFSSSALVIEYEGTNNSTVVPHRPPPGGDRCATFYGYVTYTISLDYVKNNIVFKDNEQLEVALTFGDTKPATSYVNITDGKAKIGVVFTNKDTWYAHSISVSSYVEKIGLMITLHPKNAPNVAPVQILKEYSVNYGNMEREGVTYH